MGISPDPRVFAPGQPYPINHLLNASSRSTGRVGTQYFQICQSAQIIIKGGAFKNRTDLLECISALRSDIITANRHLSSRGPYLAKHHADGGAFPSAVVA